MAVMILVFLAIVLEVVGFGLYTKLKPRALKDAARFFLPAGAAFLLLIAVVASSLPVAETYRIGFRNGEKIVALRESDGKAKTVYLNKVDRTQDRFQENDRILIVTDRFGDVIFVARAGFSEEILREGEYSDEKPDSEGD